jgi:hypothetical protein
MQGRNGRFLGKSSWLANHLPQASGRLARTFKSNAGPRAQGVPSLLGPTVPQGSNPFVPGLDLPIAIATGRVPTSVVTGDFNRDGKMDFAVANGLDDNVWVYLGHGDGTLDIPKIVSLTQGVSPVWLAAADLRNNGILDLIVADVDSASVGVFLGNGNGTFSYEHFYDAGGRPVMLTVGDFNGDGKKDLFLDFIDSAQSSFVTLLGNGQGGFGAPVYSPEVCCYQDPFGVVAMDVDHDGRDEVAAAIVGTGGGVVLKADATGAFHIVQQVAVNGVGLPPIGNGVTGAAFGDMDEDGCPDSLSGWYFGNVVVRKGTCNATAFSDPYPDDAEMGDSIGQMIVADLNHDGHLDVITGGWISNSGEGVYGYVAADLISVAFGKGDGSFDLAQTYRAGQSTFSLAVADFNNDGMLDIVGTSQDTDSVTLLLSDGAGGYRGSQGVYIGYGPGGGAVNAPLSAASFADVTGDGIPDLVQIDIERWYGAGYQVAVTQGLRGACFGKTTFSQTNISVPTTELGDYKLGDFNGDGKLDILIDALDLAPPAYIDFLPGNGDGSFGAPTLTMDPTAHGDLGVGDFNGDGKLDFAVSGMTNDGTAGGQITVYLGNGDGTFRKMSTQKFTVDADEITRFYTGDFNHDGKLDAIVYFTANGFWTSQDQVLEFLGKGDGTFQPAQKLFEPFSPFAMADLNHDGNLDIFRWGGVPDINGQNQYIDVGVHLGKPNGTFAAGHEYVPYLGTGGRPPFAYLRPGDPWQSSFVADYSGDSIPDVAVGITPLTWPYYAWMQIMQGNGDGTLSPTFNIYDLRKEYFVPQYAADLDNDGRTEMIEVDGLRSSMHVIRTKPAPALQVYLDTQRMETDQGHGWVVLNVPPASAATVALSSSDPSVSLPTSIQVAAGGSAEDFTFTLAPTLDFTKALEISAQYNGETASAVATRDRVIGFTVDAAPTTPPEVYNGESAQPIQVTAKMVPGYTGTLKFDCGQIQPFVHCQFTPVTAVVGAGGTAHSTLVVSTDPNQWSYLDFEARATDTQVMHRKWLHINLARFYFALDAGLTVYRGKTTTLPLFVTGIPPFHLTCPGLPAGISCSFDASGWDNQNWTVNMNVTTAQNVPDSDYAFTINGTSSRQAYSSPASVHVALAPDYTIESSSQPAWMLPGETADVSVRFTANATFAGGLNLSCDSVAFADCGSWHPFLSPGQSLLANVALQAKPGIAPGTYPLTITATMGSLSHSITLQMKIVSLSSTVSSTALTMAPGGTATLNVSASVSGDLTTDIRILCNAPVSIYCSPAPPSGTVSPGSPLQSVLTLSASASASRRAAMKGLLIACMLPLAIFVVPSLRTRKVALLLLVSALGLALLCCGGNSASGTGPPPPTNHTYTVQVRMQTTRGADTLTIDVAKVSLTIQH